MKKVKFLGSVLLIALTVAAFTDIKDLAGPTHPPINAPTSTTTTVPTHPPID